MISPSTHIDAQVGNVSGGSQVAIGNYIVQIGRVEGGVVNILNEAPPPPRIRPQPVLLRPKPFLNLLDRETETTTLLDALKSQQSVECTGEAGAGKTSLLRHLAHETQLTTVFSAGVVYFEVNQQSAADLLKSIFDAFYICDFPIKPNETEIRHYLQSVSALVLLDDVEIDAKQIESLMNVAPSCTFVAVTRERALFGDVVDVTLKGLPAPDAVRLFQNELRRTLSTEEEKGAQIICESVACIPLLILRAAHEARAKNRSLLDVVSESKLAPGDQRLAASDINSSSEDEKKVLAALAVFPGARVAAEHVAAVAGITNAEPLLEDLERRGLVQSHEQQYTLASDVKAAQLGNLKPWFARAVVHFIDWTKERRNQHKLIAGSAAAILLLLQRAVAAQAWNEVRSLGHAVEEALTVSGKWDMWATVLNHINTAARAQGDIAEQAWVLHQLGTRALLLGDSAVARADLTDALDIRERLNDASGAAVTRHNLNILLAPLPAQDNSSDGAGGGSTPAWLKVVVMSLAGLAVVTVVLLVWYFWNRNSQPPVVPPKIASFTISPAAIPANGQCSYRTKHRRKKTGFERMPECYAQRNSDVHADGLRSGWDQNQSERYVER
jgi:predicted ATPase